MKFLEIAFRFIAVCIEAKSRLFATKFLFTHLY